MVKRRIKRLKRKINAPIVAGLILVGIGAYCFGGAYLMTMFKNYPCVQFWCYTTGYFSGAKSSAYTLPNGTRVQGYGLPNVKVEMTCPECTDTPPIDRTGRQRWSSYTDSYGLTFFQFGFDVQVEKVWRWKATFPSGKIHSGLLYLPKEGIDVFVFVEEDRGLTHIYPADLLREQRQENSSVTVKVLINDVEAGDAPLYIRTGEITIKIIPSDISKVTSIRATIDGNDISLERMDSCYVAGLTLQDGRHVLKVYVNEIEAASIGLKIDSNWMARIAVGAASAALGVICILAGMRRK